MKCTALGAEKSITVIWNKMALTKEEAAEYSHIGINKLEELLKIPNCPFVLYVGKKEVD